MVDCTKRFLLGGAVLGDELHLTGHMNDAQGKPMAGREERFDMLLTFHPHKHAWSIPGDPRNLRLSDIGADVLVTEANSGEAGLWRLDIAVTHQRFEMR